MKKKIYILLYCDKTSKNIYDSHKFLINEFDKKLKNFYLLNYYYLNFPSKKLHHEKRNKKFKIFEPKDFYELNKFTFNKDIICILINNFGNNLPSLRTYLMFKKLKFKLIQLKDMPVINQKDKLIFKRIFKSSRYKLQRSIYEWSQIILKSLNILPRFEIFFTSNKKEFNQINNNLLFKLGISSFKKIILINSKTFDALKKQKPKISNKFIVLLDDFFEHPSSIKLRGKIQPGEIKKHYFLLNKFLYKIKNTLKKKIVICIHPRDNLSKKKKIFKNFNVIQYQTQKYIYQSFLIMFFDTTSIIDGVNLKKKMLAIYSDYNDENVKYHIKGYEKNLSIKSHQISNLNFTKRNILEKSKKPLRSFSDFKMKYINPAGDIYGIKIILKEIFKI